MHIFFSNVYQLFRSNSKEIQVKVDLLMKFSKMCAGTFDIQAFGNRRVGCTYMCLLHIYKISKNVSWDNTWNKNSDLIICIFFLSVYNLFFTYPSILAFLCSIKSVLLTFCDTMDHSSTGPLLTGFPNQEYCNGLPCPPPGDLPHSRIEPRSPQSPALQEDPLLLSHWGSQFIFFSWAQLLSRVQLFAIPWTVVRWVSFSITNSRSLLKLMSIKSAMPSNYLILCIPLLLPSIFHSIRVFSSESVLPIRWPKYWSFSFSISPSNEYSGLISFRIDWFDHLAFQGTLKSLFQHHSSKASILQHSAFFIV